MGLIVLHSGHFSKIFKRLMGTTCNLKWREAARTERIWVDRAGPPDRRGPRRIYRAAARGDVRRALRHPRARTTLVFVSWFQGGEVFRSGCCYYARRGKVFYFRPGHETYPTYYDPNVQRVIANAVRWAAPRDVTPLRFGRSAPLEVLA